RPVPSSRVSPPPPSPGYENVTPNCPAESVLLRQLGPHCPPGATQPKNRYSPPNTVAPHGCGGTRKSDPVTVIVDVAAAGRAVGVTVSRGVASLFPQLPCAAAGLDQPGAPRAGRSVAAIAIRATTIR